MNVRFGFSLMAAAVALLASPGAICRADSMTSLMSLNTVPLSNADINWTTSAAQANRAEVMLGELAMQRSRNPAVRRFAQTMIDQHSDANNKLLSVLARHNEALPETVNSRQSRLYDSLRRLSGSEFDAAYISANVAAHREAARLFRAGESAQSPDVRAYARAILPHVSMHLAMASELQQRGFYAHRRMRR